MKGVATVAGGVKVTVVPLVLVVPCPESGWLRPMTVKGTLRSGSVSLASTLSVIALPAVVAALSLTATGGLLASSSSSWSAVRKVGRPTEATYSTPSQPGSGVGITWNWPGCSRSQRSSIEVSSCWVLWQCSM
ncbi:hypothetical protein D3C81_1583710 [compost metagenome]